MGSTIFNVLLGLLAMYFVLVIIFKLLRLIFRKIFNKNNSQKQENYYISKPWKPQKTYVDKTTKIDIDENTKVLIDEVSDKLALVKNAKYSVKSLMNKEEVRVFYKIEEWVKNRNMGERVFSEVPLGVYLKTPCDSAHLAIRYKRADFIIVDRLGKAKCAIEYQGSGHYQEDALERDKLKAEALASAGVILIEIFENEKDNKSIIWQKLEKAFVGNV